MTRFVPRSRSCAVRNRFLIVPSVGCSNSVLNKLSSSFPDVAVISHQHGCGQVGHDLKLTQLIIAGHLSHPNVSQALLIGLGCETNQVGLLLDLCKESKDRINAFTIQEVGGFEAAVRKASDFIQGSAIRTKPPDRLEDLVVGIMADSPSLFQAAKDLASYLRSQGVIVRELEQALPEPRYSRRNRSNAQSVPAQWRTSAAKTSQLVSLLASSDTIVPLPVAIDPIRQLTVLVAAGCHVVVRLVEGPALIGSCIAPTITVSTSRHTDELQDFADVKSGARLEPRLLECLTAVAHDRRLTTAEQLGCADFAMPRTAPFY